MRRLLQKHANRTCLCRTSTRSLLPDCRGSSSIRSNSFGASKRQVAIEATPTTARVSIIPPISSLRSRFFETLFMSRSFSVEAISARTANNDVMMSPFWYHGRVNSANFPKESVAPLELFRAILTLKRVSAPKDSLLGDESYVEKWDNSRTIRVPKVEENHDSINDTDTFGTNTRNSDLQAKHGENNIYQVKQSLSHELESELQQKKMHSTTDLTRIVNIFQEECSSTHELLTDKQLTQMFYYLIDLDVHSSYEVLKYYVSRCKGKGRLVTMDMYLKLIQQIRPCHKKKFTSNLSNVTKGRDPLALQSLIHDITQHIKEEYSEGKAVVYQYLLLPELMSTLMDYKNYDISSMATPIMDYILEREFPILNPDLYEYVLTKGRRGDHGQVNFPYGRVLSEMVLSGYIPKPTAVIATLQCYHPFTDLKSTQKVLSIIQQLHNLHLDSPMQIEGYPVDFGTLESISMASARKDADLVLLVWDLVEQFGYTPTASMYEDVVLTFAATHQDENLYAALADMEKNGFVPSPVLLRFIAWKITYVEKRARHSRKMLTWHRNNHLRSTHAMNSLLIGYGMKRDINNAFLIFEDFATFNIQPDATTFAFLMEALYIDAKHRFPYRQRLQFNPQDIEDVVGAAQIVIDAMAEAGLKKTKQFFYEHIRLLCTLDLLEDAKSVIVEEISAGTPVPKATLFLLGSRFASVGEFENAHAIARLSRAAGCGEFPRLVNHIKQLEAKRV